jgi:hypothetical protein
MAIIAAVFAASLLVGADPHPKRRAIAAGLLAATAMLANTKLMGAGDTRPAAYLPFALGRTHSLTFETLIESNRCLLQSDGSLPYWFVSTRGDVASKYPLLTGLLALPIEWRRSLESAADRSR